MRTSSFEHIVRLQFNSLMLIVIKNKVKSRNRQLARHSKREVLVLCQDFGQLKYKNFQFLV